MKTLLLLLVIGFFTPNFYGHSTANNAVLTICNDMPCGIQPAKKTGDTAGIPCVLNRESAHTIRLEIRAKDLKNIAWTAGGRFHCPQSLRIDSDLSWSVLGAANVVIPPGDYPFTLLFGSYVVYFNTP